MNIEAHDWRDARESIHGRWPDGLVRVDLAFWADPHACDGRSRPPIRALARTWGWSKSAAARAVGQFDGARYAGADGDNSQQVDLAFDGSHDDLVERAVRWMRNTLKCKAVVPERQTISLPYAWDVVGIQRGLSVAVECKRTRSDFLADRRKWIAQNPSKALGDLRWYFVRPGIVSIDDVPEGWGLAVCGERIVRVLRRPTPVERCDHEHELLFYGAVIDWEGRA